MPNHTRFWLFRPWGFPISMDPSPTNNALVFPDTLYHKQVITKGPTLHVFLLAHHLLRPIQIGTYTVAAITPPTLSPITPPTHHPTHHPSHPLTHHPSPLPQLTENSSSSPRGIYSMYFLSPELSHPPSKSSVLTAERDPWIEIFWT